MKCNRNEFIRALAKNSNITNKNDILYEDVISVIQPWTEPTLLGY